MSELPELVQALLDPKAYPETPPGVELRETHISCVFLAGDFVYKIKKPVDFGFVDYTTLEKRLACCYKEVELNRRLCPGAYLGVVPVTGGGGLYSIGGEGEAIEYAVKMRRLPDSAMMNVLLPAGRVTVDMVAAVAGVVAAFHQKAATGGDVDRLGGIDTVIQNTSENFAQTERYFDTIIAPAAFRRIKGYTEGFIRANAPLFGERVAGGRIRDCHGDLHAAHICFQDGICIYDCIEFNDRFRYCDVASEVAFLAMDLDHYGRADLSRTFVDAYAAASGDGGMLGLLNFYKCYRAYVRGKVACLQYDEPHLSAAERRRVVAGARGYFELAERYVEAID